MQVAFPAGKGKADSSRGFQEEETCQHLDVSLAHHILEFCPEEL